MRKQQCDFRIFPVDGTLRLSHHPIHRTQQIPVRDWQWGWGRMGLFLPTFHPVPAGKRETDNE